MPTQWLTIHQYLSSIWTHVLAMYCFAVTFVINGINSGRWLTRQLSARSSCVRVTCKFYWQRLTAIISITYLYYTAFTMSNLVVFKSTLFTTMLWDSLWPNLFFVSNFVSIESNVSIGQMCWRRLIWVKADVHLGAKFGQSCAVKYSFGVNKTLLCSQQMSTSQYNRSYG